MFSQLCLFYQRLEAQVDVFVSVKVSFVFSIFDAYVELYFLRFLPSLKIRVWPQPWKDLYSS